MSQKVQDNITAAKPYWATGQHPMAGHGYAQPGDAVQHGAGWAPQPGYGSNAGSYSPTYNNTYMPQAEDNHVLAVSSMGDSTYQRQRPFGTSTGPSDGPGSAYGQVPEDFLGPTNKYAYNRTASAGV